MLNVTWWEWLTQAAPRRAELPPGRSLWHEHVHTDHADSNQCKEQQSSLKRTSKEVDKHWIQPSSPNSWIYSKYQKEYCWKSFCRLVAAPLSNSRVSQNWDGNSWDPGAAQELVRSWDFSQHSLPKLSENRSVLKWTHLTQSTFSYTTKLHFPLLTTEE